MRKLIALVLIASLVAAGCASSHVMIGTARPAISPDQVKVYFHPPAKYDEIALIDTSSNGALGIGAQAKTDIVIRRLKEEAAKLGANGVLLQSIGSESSGSVSTGFGQASSSGNHAYGTGLGISGNIMQKSGTGLAIFVTQD
jgi:hypothetical protein